MRRVPFLDASGAAALEQFVEQAARGGTRVILSGVQPQPLSVLTHTGLAVHAGSVEYVPDYPAAIALAAGKPLAPA